MWISQHKHMINVQILKVCEIFFFLAIYIYYIIDQFYQYKKMLFGLFGSHFYLIIVKNV